MRLIIPPEVESKIHAYVMAVEGEIAGMGKVKVNEDTGDIVVEDVCIYDQEVTGGTADLSTEALAGFMMEKIQAGESLAPWILWWHSHSNMAAFFSGRDTSTIDGSTDFQHLISLVVNKRRERECRIDTFRPFRMTTEDVSVVVPGSSFIVPEDIKEEVAAKVKEKKTSWQGNGSTHGHYEGTRWVPHTGQHSLYDDEHPWDTNGAKKVGSLLAPFQPAGFRNGNESDSRNWNPNNGNTASGGAKDEVEFDTIDDFDQEQLRQIIAGAKAQMQAMVDYGKDDSPEYIQMQNDLADYEYQLAELEREEFLDGLTGN